MIIPFNRYPTRANNMFSPEQTSSLEHGPIAYKFEHVLGGECPPSSLPSPLIIYGNVFFLSFSAVLASLLTIDEPGLCGANACLCDFIRDSSCGLYLRKRCRVDILLLPNTIWEATDHPKKDNLKFIVYISWVEQLQVWVIHTLNIADPTRPMGFFAPFGIALMPRSTSS